MTKASVRGIGTAAVFVASGLALSACDDTGTEPADGTAFFTAAMSGAGGSATDALTAADENEDNGNCSEIDGVDGAEIEISSIYFQGVPDGGRLEVWNAEDDGGQSNNGENDNEGNDDGTLTVDLCALAAGEEVHLIDEEDAVEGPSGEYGQLRLVAERGSALLEGESDWWDMKLPSAAQSGIKILPPRGGDDENGEAEVEAENGETVHLEIAVEDVEGNFVFQGPPHDPHGVLFTPVLRLRE